MNMLCYPATNEENPDGTGFDRYVGMRSMASFLFVLTRVRYATLTHQKQRISLVDLNELIIDMLGMPVTLVHVIEYQKRILPH